MTLEGPAGFAELQDALDRAREAVADCDQEAARLDGELRQLLASRGETLLRLARHYLPEVSRAAIELTFEGIRGDLLAILARRDAKRADLKPRIEEGNVEIARRNQEVDAVTRRLNEKVAQREQLEAQVVEILKGNADFQERSKLALQAEEKLHRDEKRVEELQRESAEKLPAFEKSRLFRYLHDRAYGTSDYQASGWVRSMDRRVADLIHYPTVLPSYEFLTRTPELVAAEVSRRRDQFNELMKQVEGIEKSEADRLGLTALLAEGLAIGTERDQLVQEVAQLQKANQGIQKELADLERAEGEYYREAIDRFQAFLGETQLAFLEKRARQTPESEDDVMVADLASRNQQIEATGSGQAELTERRQRADQIQHGLDRLLRKYRQANYDSDRSILEGLSLPHEIARFEDGEIDSDDLWRSIQQAQSFRPSPVGQAVNHGIEFAASPAGRIILGAIVDVAGAALREAAYRGVQRRSDSTISFPSFPSSGSLGGDAPRSTPSPNPPTSSPEGGFTSGEGF